MGAGPTAGPATGPGTGPGSGPALGPGAKSDAELGGGAAEDGCDRPAGGSGSGLDVTLCEFAVR